ncbi:MAG: ABC transporter permease [Betaproteobacteria bacterium]
MTALLLRQAWRAIGAYRLRAALTMLGMVIGVASVVLMLAIGQGVQTTVNETIASMGTNLLVVQSGAPTRSGLRMPAGEAATLTLEDAAAIAEFPQVQAVAPIAQGVAQLVYGGKNWNSPVLGSTPAYFQVQDWGLKRGGYFTEADVKRATQVAVIGQTVATNLFGSDAQAVGQTIRLKGHPYTVIGLLARKGQSLDGRDQDDQVVVPVSTAQRKLFAEKFDTAVRVILVQVRDARAIKTSEAQIKSLLRQRHKITTGAEDDFSVNDLTQLTQAASRSSQALVVLLAAIASISMIVGGIGIMNIMLVSVTERAREIGLRMAIGATPAQILGQFLAEALLLALGGCVAGLALGALGAVAVAQLAGYTVVLSVGAGLIAAAIAAAVSLFFGIWPANKAARLRPADALRQL